MLDKSITEDNLGELDGQVIFVRRAILSDGWANGNGRYGDILPYELLGPSKFGTKAKQLAILHDSRCEHARVEVGWGVLTSADIRLKRSKTLSGLRSS